MFPRKLCFDDVLLVPQYSTLHSRTEPDLSTRIDKVQLNIPIIPSPMDTISGPEMLITISNQGGMGLLTRYINMSFEEELERQRKELLFAIKNSDYPDLIGCAIGVNGNLHRKIKTLFNTNCRIFCIDVGHADHMLVHTAIDIINKLSIRKQITLIVGNICTPSAAIKLAQLGVDCIKCGTGSGSICTTRIITGHGYPQFSSIFEISKTIRENGYETSIISDGGIRSEGDMIKCLAAGANVIMLGYMLSGSSDTPKLNNKNIYRGMSTLGASGRTNVAEEGISLEVPNRGNTAELIKSYVKGIKSGLAMCGARNLLELRNKAEFIEVSVLTKKESLPVNFI